jgi:GNAT superfamily N-acetyltransferase
MSSAAQLTIRPAEAGDALALAGVNHETWLATYRGILDAATVEARTLEDEIRIWQDLLTERNPSQQRFVALENDRIVGYCGGGRNADTRSPFPAELFGIYVLPGWQSKGVGKKLLGTLAQWLRLQGWSAMQVWVLERNPYRRFYEGCGATLLDQTRDVDYGGKMLTVVSYGWTDLDKLTEL